jgi:hypothetical protein
MIFDRLNNAEQYFSLGENIKKGFEFLLNSDLENLEDGKYEISGEDIYANIQSLTTKPTEEQKAEIEKTAQAILDARALYPDCSLADLYDELTMPPELRKAHKSKPMQKPYRFQKAR